MLPLRTQKEIKHAIWEEIKQKFDQMKGIVDIGVTVPGDGKKWSLYITAPEAPFRDDALLHAQTVSARLVHDFDLADLVPLTMEIAVKPGVGYRVTTLRTVADIDDFENWLRLAQTPTTKWVIARQVIDAAKARPTDGAIRAATTFVRAALRSDGNLAN